MAQAGAIARGFNNRSHLICRDAEPLFGIAALVWAPAAGAEGSSSAFDLYVTAAVAAIFGEYVPDELPQSLDAARGLAAMTAEDLARSPSAFERLGAVDYLMVELLDNNERWIVDGSEGPDVRSRARAHGSGEREWAGSEVTRRRALALALEPLLLGRVRTDDFSREHSAAIRHDRQMLRQVLWLLSPDSALTLLLRAAMTGRSGPALAEACGVSPSTITSWKRGGALPRPDRFEILAATLGTDVATLAAATADRVPAGWHLDPGDRFSA